MYFPNFLIVRLVAVFCQRLTRVSACSGNGKVWGLLMLSQRTGGRVIRTASCKSAANVVLEKQLRFLSVDKFIQQNKRNSKKQIMASEPLQPTHTHSHTHRQTKSWYEVCNSNLKAIVLGNKERSLQRFISWRRLLSPEHSEAFIKIKWLHRDGRFFQHLQMKFLPFQRDIQDKYSTLYGDKL